MKHALSALALAALMSVGAPAAAGTASFDLPRLDFPAPGGDEAGQGCASPATLDASRCDRGRG